MPKTRVKERMKDVNRLLQRDKGRVQQGPYKEFLDALDVLVEKTEALYQKGDEGHIEPMTPESYQQLMKSYGDVYKACREYENYDYRMEKLDEKRNPIVTRIKSYVKQDMGHLKTLDMEHLPPLPEAIKTARTVQVDLTGKKLDVVGANQSKRIAMKSAKGTRGFFTEKSGYDRQKEWEQTLDKIMPRVPEEYRKDLEALRNDEKRRDDFISLSQREHVYQENPEAILDKIYDVLYPQDPDKKMSLAYDDSEDLDMEEFKEALLTLSMESLPIMVRGHFMDALGVESRGRLDQRNSAMSAVAGLLGNGKCIAKAVPMTIKIDDRIVEGTFMEAAEGVDVNHLNETHRYLKDLPEDMVATPEALKQLAELDVLDYICGNVDRHLGNMMYQFEVGEDNKPRIKEITGIDNDSSFGRKELIGPVASSGGLESIRYISERQWKVIKNLSDSAIKETLLPFELTEKEIKAVSKRVQGLKYKVKRKEINVLKDSEWKNKSMEELGKNTKNIFGRIANVPKLIKRDLKELEEKSTMAGRKLTFAEGQQVEGLYRADLDKTHEKLMGLVDGIRKADANLYINSSEFKNMRDAAYALGKFSAQLMEKYSSNDRSQISEEDRQKFGELFEEMQQTSQAYIDDKAISPRTEHGKLRLDLANRLRDLSSDSLELIGQEKESIEKEEPSLDDTLMEM